MRRGKCQETASYPSIDVYFRIMPENTPDASKEELLRGEIKRSRETRTSARRGGGRRINSFRESRRVLQAERYSFPKNYPSGINVDSFREPSIARETNPIERRPGFRRETGSNRDISLLASIIISAFARARNRPDQRWR